MRIKQTIIGICLSLMASEAWAAPIDISRCTDATSADRMIVACTMTIDSGDLDAVTRAHALRVRGRALASKNDMDRALADENESIRLDPNIDQAYLTRAFVYGSRNDTAKALADYEAALHLNPNFARAYIDRGSLLARGGDFAKAIGDFTQAIGLEPDANLALFFRAQARIQTGDKAGALEDMDAAIRIEPRNQQLIATRNQMRRMKVAAIRRTAPSALPSPPQGDLSGIDDKTLRQRVVKLYEDRKDAEGLRLAEIYADRMARHAGAESELYAEALGMKAMLLDALARYAEAATAYAADIAILQNLRRPDDEALLKRRMDLGQDDLNLSRFDDAKAIAQDVLKIRQAKFGRRNPEVAGALFMLSSVAFRRYDFAAAEALDKEALAIWQSQDPNSFHVAGALDLLASCYARQNRRPEAEAAYRQAMVVIARVLGPDSYEMSISLDNLASVVNEEGRTDEAERLYKQALGIEEKLYGPDDPRVADTLSHLASLFSESRRDKDAEAVQRRVLAIQEKAYGPDNHQVGVTLENMGGALVRRGRPAEGEKFLARSLAIFEKTEGTDSPGYAITLNALASAIREQGRKSEAEQLWRRALAIERKASGTDLASVAQTLNNLGTIAKDDGRPQEAEVLFSEALNDYERSTAADPVNLAYTHEYLSNLAKDRGDFASAAAHVAQAVAGLEKAYGPTHPKAIDARMYQAALAIAQKDWPQALSIERQLAALALQASSRDAALAKSGDAAGRIANIGAGTTAAAWHVAADDPSSKAALADETFVAAQKAYQSSAGAALTQMAARFAASGTPVAPLVREQQDLSARADALDASLNRMLAGPAAGRSEAALSKVRADMAEVAARIEALSAQIARDFPAYANLSNPAPSTIAEVQKQLGPDEALVTWFVFDEEGYVWAITHERSAWARLDLDKKALTAEVEQLRATLDLGSVSRGLARTGPKQDVLFNLERAHDLYEHILAPVEPLVGSKTSLIVVPTGALTSLPLHLLVTAAPARAATSMTDVAYRDAAWLVRRQAITVMPTVAALRALRAETRPSHATKPLVGFADPVFGQGASGDNRGLVRVEDKPVEAYASYYDDGVVDVDALRRGLPPLPETADELREVARQLAAPASDLHFGADVTVPEVEHVPLDSYHVVYFATHGLVAGDVKGLSEPALALTVPAKASATDNGLLTASDVTQLKLDADWVVLSACNTAVGEKPGAEGLSGLARAFFYAGARALLVSHWPVQSSAAVELATRTFAAMNADPTLGRAEALRRSMVALIASRPENAYPAVWAPFVVVGEGRR